MSEASFTSEDDFNFKGSAADLREWSLRQPATGRCAFCPEWKVEGTSREVVALAEEHRREVHPELSHLKKRRHKGHLMRWRSTLDEESSLEIEETRSKRMRLLGID